MNENGLIKTISNHDFDTTYSNLKNILVNNPNLKVIAELDHQQNASRVDLTLPPTRIIFFGNPNLGTPLMNASRTVGIDLPQKMLVYQEGDTVTVAYNDPAYLVKRHQLSGVDVPLEKMTGALAMIAKKATE